MSAETTNQIQDFFGYRQFNYIDNKVHFKSGRILSVGDGAVCRVTTGFNILVIRKLRNEDVLKDVPLKAGEYLE